jgi:hypothetical protein
MVGARKRNPGGYERDDLEWYVEPRYAVDALFDALSFGQSTIYDPCAGSGTIPLAAAGAGYSACGSDIVRRVWPETAGDLDAIQLPELDFFAEPHDAGFNTSIVSNPPFSRAEEFIRKALPKVHFRLAVILPMSFLCSQARYRLFTEFPPSDLLFLSQRPSMPPGHMIGDMGGKAFKGGTVDYFWLVFTNPHDRETRARWLAPRGRE